jgi:hypothetical protein
MRTRSWSDEQLAAAIAASITWAQVARALGLKAEGGSSYYRLRAVAQQLDLDTSHFLGRLWSKGTGRGRDAEKQRAAARRWYQDNKQVYLDRNRAHHLENAARLRVLKDVPCADCGARFPACCMDFDHRDGESKIGNISNLIKRWSWERLATEMEKCDIVCANCHRIRTAQRAGRLSGTEVA